MESAAQDLGELKRDRRSESDRTIPQIFIPCPVCGASVELPAGLKELPPSIECPSCGTLLRR